MYIKNTVNRRRRCAAFALLGLIGGAIAAVAVGGLIFWLISKAQDVDLKNKQEGRPTNAPPWLVSAGITLPAGLALAEVTNVSQMPMAAPLRTLTMRSDDLREWVTLDDSRDLWEIAREAAKSGKVSEFFIRMK